MLAPPCVKQTVGMMRPRGAWRLGANAIELVSVNFSILVLQSQWRQRQFDNSSHARKVIGENTPH